MNFGQLQAMSSSYGSLSASRLLAHQFPQTAFVDREEDCKADGRKPSGVCDPATQRSLRDAEYLPPKIHERMEAEHEPKTAVPTQNRASN